MPYWGFVEKGRGRLSRRLDRALGSFLSHRRPRFFILDRVSLLEVHPNRVLNIVVKILTENPGQITVPKTIDIHSLT
jgi:hypothetical protein